MNVGCCYVYREIIRLVIWPDASYKICFWNKSANILHWHLIAIKVIGLRHARFRMACIQWFYLKENGHRIFIFDSKYSQYIIWSEFLTQWCNRPLLCMIPYNSTVYFWIFPWIQREFLMKTYRINTWICVIPSHWFICDRFSHNWALYEGYYYQWLLHTRVNF